MNKDFGGVTFAQQKITPTDDAIIRRAILGDGILTGCALSYTGSTLTMGAGQLMACGRQIRNPAPQNWAVSDAVSGFARLVLTIDLTRTATKDTFSQVYTAIEYASAADGFHALIQEDINDAGTEYQIAVCVMSLSAGGISGIVDQLDLANASLGNKSQIIVTAETGSVIVCTKAGTTKTAAEKNGTWTFRGLDLGTWVITATKGDKRASRTVEITRLSIEYISLSYNTIPKFTYSGSYKIVNDAGAAITESQGGWNIQFLTSGTLTISELNGADDGIDVFVLGGGGGGGGGTNAYITDGGSGGPGYNATGKGIAVAAGKAYTITVGKGGAAGTHGTGNAYGTAGGAGGASAAFGKTANGGGAGPVGKEDDAVSGVGGSQAYAFGGTSGTVYAKRGTAVAANSGNSGRAGMSKDSSTTAQTPTAGSSGIVIIRNAR